MVENYIVKTTPIDCVNESKGIGTLLRMLLPTPELVQKSSTLLIETKSGIYLVKGRYDESQKFRKFAQHDTSLLSSAPGSGDCICIALDVTVNVDGSVSQ